MHVLAYMHIHTLKGTQFENCYLLFFSPLLPWTKSTGTWQITQSIIEQPKPWPVSHLEGKQWKKVFILDFITFSVDIKIFASNVPGIFFFIVLHNKWRVNNIFRVIWANAEPCWAWQPDKWAIITQLMKSTPSEILKTCSLQNIGRVRKLWQVEELDNMFKGEVNT